MGRMLAEGECRKCLLCLSTCLPRRLPGLSPSRVRHGYRDSVDEGVVVGREAVGEVAVCSSLGDNGKVALAEAHISGFNTNNLSPTGLATPKHNICCCTTFTVVVVWFVPTQESNGDSLEIVVWGAVDARVAWGVAGAKYGLVIEKRTLGGIEGEGGVRTRLARLEYRIPLRIIAHKARHALSPHNVGGCIENEGIWCWRCAEANRDREHVFVGSLRGEGGPHGKACSRFCVLGAWIHFHHKNLDEDRSLSNEQ
ncbi:prephenate dehydratase [Striga asiatica]|uniref:Prephenate dehydratase n=1 Tax=Striga asiatica TaxID=4170 RepID=A0A5A7QW93_STRAF|nr:prephenate dehydratase [Striga asiatica]